MNNYRYHEPTDENPTDESIEKGVSRLIVFTLCAVVLVVGIMAGIMEIFENKKGK